MSKTTIRDVAEFSGVSISTVSRVLNNNPKVDPTLKEKVLAAARALNYHTGIISPLLSSEQKAQIAIIVPALENSYYSSIVAGAIDAAKSLKQQVIVMITKSDPAREEQCFQELLSTSISGIIFASSNGSNPIDRFPELKQIPMVIAARRHIADGISHVYADNETAGYIATKYLLRLNRKRIVLFTNFWGKSIHTLEDFNREYEAPTSGGFTAFDRFHGYCRALEEEGIPFDPNLLIFSGYTFEEGYTDAQRLLASSTDFDAILTPNDRLAAGVLRLMNEQGLRIPSQISLICFNGGLMANVVTPPLTIIKQDNYQLGAKAVQQLNDVINGKPARDIKLDVQLQIQGSTTLL